MALCFYHEPKAIARFLLSVPHSQTVFLCDQNTHKHCFIPFFAPFFAHSHVIIIEPGESSKSIQQVAIILDSLLAIHADRDTLFVNLGGGVVTDLGGFCSAIFKRGIACIHIPTSLMAMADASIGGKTGVNLSQVKNAVGSFYPPKQVAVCSSFLKTLPQDEILSGWAEMVKMRLLFDPNALNILQLTSEKKGYHLDDIAPHLTWCTQKKWEIVEQDPTEQHLRKVLNYGHTLGHAIESSALSQGINLSHGYAVGLGMQLENDLALHMGMMQVHTHKAIQSVLKHYFPMPPDLAWDAHILWEFVLNDKKNQAQQIRCVLISEPGVFSPDVVVSQADIMHVIQSITK